MDKVDEKTRSRIMATVKSKDTKPELRVRSAAHKLGLRFRLHSSKLPGKPDLVFPSRRVALFVHGCFWHGHTCKRGDRMPATNTQYWRDKIARNKKRDAVNQSSLSDLGWRPIVVWECQTSENELPSLLSVLIVAGATRESPRLEDPPRNPTPQRPQPQASAC